MSTTYSQHANICAKFYDLTLDKKKTGEFVFSKSQAQPGTKALFVGGMFEIADYLRTKDLDLVVADYSTEMVELGREKLLEIRVERADLKELPFEAEFDIVFVIGRVFTHMISNEDLISALESCNRALKLGGKLFFDNYEDSKISTTNYFNGEVNCEEGDTKILRSSKTSLVSQAPYVVEWDATYSGTMNGEEFKFTDTMEHRAWSRSEISEYLNKTEFKMLDQGDNFDETSFYSLALKG